ncbi:MAG: type II toxin-antitoxin system HicA family toxin [Actinomycetota bacterium]|nr:type II toxin-antitoxin system HicA family toxin [Actinomycetota bacterium]
MKRRQLLKRIAVLARGAGVTFEFSRHGGEHDLYYLHERAVWIPRHSEINELTARAELKKCITYLEELNQ